MSIPNPTEARVEGGVGLVEPDARGGLCDGPSPAAKQQDPAQAIPERIVGLVGLDMDIAFSLQRGRGGKIGFEFGRVVFMASLRLVPFGTLTLLTLMLLPSASSPLKAAGDEDIAELQAAHEAMVQAKGSADAGELAALSHPQAVVFLRGAAFPFDSDGMPSEMVRSSWEHGFDFVESISVSVIDPIYRVVGDTGVVTSHERLVVKPKDGALRTYNNRVTSTYARADGRWLLVSHHESPIPDGNL